MAVDSAPSAQRGGPVRTCIGCRARVDSSELVRVTARDGICLPDMGSRRPGRGAHLHPTRACWDLAERRRAFSRALRVGGDLDTRPVRSWLESSWDTDHTTALEG